MEKDLILKNSLIGILIILLPILFFNKEKIAQSVFKEEKNVSLIVNKILDENKEKEKIAYEDYHTFIYLAFQHDEQIENYFIDTKSGEEKKFESFLKKDKQAEFKNKIAELLNVKYPKFITDALKEITEVQYLLEKNHLVMVYPHLENIEEAITLRVNYQEITEFIDFTVPTKQDEETKGEVFAREDGYNYSKDKKTIAFTFDDGPSGKYTNELVEILKENKAHATFFMVGNRMESGANVIQNVLKNGNEIGSHSYAHKNMARQKIKDIVEGEKKTNEIYKRLTGSDLIYTRPPYGNINKEIKENLNTIFINWNVDTEDWLHRNKEHIVNHILENAKDGDIILMHDCYETTVEAVREVLPLLYAKGFQVVSVSELAELKEKTLETHALYRSIN